MDILVSVIVPVYNVAPFLRKCIDYIIVQSFADFELLLIDDGSQDDVDKCECLVIGFSGESLGFGIHSGF